MDSEIQVPFILFLPYPWTKLAHQHVRILITEKGKKVKVMIPRIHYICSHSTEQNLITWRFQLANKVEESSLFSCMFIYSAINSVLWKKGKIGRQ